MVNFRKLFRLEEKQESQEVEQYYPRAVNLHVQEMGAHGTEIFSGYITEDYLDAMNGTEKADTFNQMKRSDYQVKMCLSAVKNPIRKANWKIEPASDDAEHVRQADLIKHILFEDMKPTWRKYLSEVLTMCEHGFSLFEVVHKPVVNHPQHGSFISIKKLAWRSQNTIERWNIDKTTKEVISVTQDAYGDLDAHVNIPVEHLLHFSIDQEGANYEGISLLRPGYGCYFRKNVYLKLNAIGIEKFAIPTPIATVPAGKENSEQYNNMVTALEYYTQHHANYITMPAGWELQMNNNSYDPQKVEVSIDNEDKRFTKAFLANFLELGMGTTGSYALSNDLSDFFLSGIEYIADEITEKTNILIKDLIIKNFGPQDAYPTLCYDGITDQAGEELARVLDILAGKKIIIPDDALEADVRQRFNLPEASEDGKREVQNQQPQFQKPEDENSLGEKIKRVMMSWRK